MHRATADACGLALDCSHCGACELSGRTRPILTLPWSFGRRLGARLVAVTETNVELARRGYGAALRGDMDTLREFLDPDVKWHGGDPSGPGACRNREQAIAFVGRALAARPVAEIVDLIDAGDQVVVVLRAPSRSGARTVLSANLTTFREGKAIEMVHYADVSDALAAAGVQRWTEPSRGRSTPIPLDSADSAGATSAVRPVSA